MKFRIRQWAPFYHDDRRFLVIIIMFLKRRHTSCLITCKYVPVTHSSRLIVDLSSFNRSRRSTTARSRRIPHANREADGLLWHCESFAIVNHLQWRARFYVHRSIRQSVLNRGYRGTYRERLHWDARRVTDNNEKTRGCVTSERLLFRLSRETANDPLGMDSDVERCRIP